MAFCDVSLRVLYDFEYTTKYGRNIKITSGERLLLIKKTNDDWWQVIRSSEERPFFVPASYVEEIESSRYVSNRDQSSTKSSLEKTHTLKNSPSSSSLPNDIRQLSSNNTASPSVDNTSNLTCSSGKSLATDFRKENTNLLKHKTLSSTMSSSGYNSLCEEIQAYEGDTSFHETNYDNRNYRSNDSLTSVNKKHSISKSNADKKHDDDAIANSPASDKELSGKLNTSCNTSSSEISENKLHKSEDGSKYCSVINAKPDPGVSSRKILSSLPASDSLENLSLQIELKTSSLRNSLEKNSMSSSDSLNKNVLSHTPGKIVCEYQIASDVFNHVDREHTEQVLYTKLPTDSQLHMCNETNYSENLIVASTPTMNNDTLQHHDKPITNIERQVSFKKSTSEKRLKNVLNIEKINTVSESVIKGNSNLFRSNTSDKSEINNENTCSITSNNNTIICNKVDEVLQKSDFQGKMLQNRQHFGSDSQLSHLKTAKEKTTSRYSLDSVVEGELRESGNQDLATSKYNSKESSLVSIISGKTNSEKSSNDSLLDVDIEGSFRKISGGTTSDSLVPTDGEDLVTSESETDSVKLAKSKLEEAKTGLKARKIPLTRRRRVFPSKSRLDLGLDPPSPVPDQSPLKVLGEGWNEYDTQDGRKFFYNIQTKEKRWKPPRRTQNANVETEDERDGAATGTEADDMFVVSLSLPPGWSSEIDPITNQTCYIHAATKAKWFSSTDSEGRVYFFEENSHKSSWTLPETSSVANSNENKTLHAEENNSVSSSPANEKSLKRNLKSKSMILATRHEESASFSHLSTQWPQLWEGTLCVLKEGPLNKTKITESGKRVRKNWASTYAVLTELLLLFFKDNKGFPSMMNGSGRPELSVDLNGAKIDFGEKVSSRKNVYMLSTQLGLQVLIQCDCSTSAQQWLQAIQGAIRNLPSGIESKGSRMKPESPVEESKSNARIGRSKSMKLKNKSASIEDLSVNVAERQTKIKERLKKFFHRRPTVELLVKKGIWKDEPVFGCLLEHACPPEPPRVPLFVQHCIRCIERSEENMKTDGLYRASGNLSQVQKIRLQVDQNMYSLLDQEEDVHVLAGTLKLFFRELKQPLIPFKFFDKALRASTNSNYAEKIKDFRDIVKSLPSCNHDTLKLLLQHLLRVTQYHEFNRMHIPNIAIVFGPTLMWPEQESQNMAFDLMQQNLVIECFLSEFHNIFR